MAVCVIGAQYGKDPRIGLVFMANRDFEVETLTAADTDVECWQFSKKGLLQTAALLLNLADKLEDWE